MDKTEKIPVWVGYRLTLVIHALFNMLPMNLEYISGAKKRAGERAKLHHE